MTAISKKENQNAVPLILGAPTCPGCYVLMIDDHWDERYLIVKDVDFFSEVEDTIEKPGLYIWDNEGIMEHVDDVTIIAHLPICYRGEQPE